LEKLTSEPVKEATKKEEPAKIKRAEPVGKPKESYLSRAPIIPALKLGNVYKMKNVV